MSEDTYPSEYTVWQDNESAIAQPYIDGSTQTPADPPLPAEAPQPAQSITEQTKADQLAAFYKLGRVQKELKYGVSHGMTIGITSCLIGILCFIPIILLVLNIGYFRGMFWTAIFGFGSFAYGINRINTSLNNLGAKVFTRNLCYYLCSQGIMRIQGTKVQALRWDEVKSIQKIPTTNHPHIPWEYVLYPFDDSEPLVLTKICITTRAIRLQIEREITRRLLPTTIIAHRTSQTLNFGSLEITPQGLRRTNAEKFLPWEKLGPISEVRGFLTIREKHTLSLLIIAEISTVLNLCVFWPLIEEIRRDQYARENLPKSTLVNHALTYTPSQQSEWQEYE